MVIGEIVGGGVEIINLVGGLFGKARDDKRKARAQMQDLLWNAGVSRSIFTGVHSDHVSELEQIAEFINRTGPAAIEYINATQGANLGPRRPPGTPMASQVIAGYNAWAKKNVPPPAPAPSSPSNGSGGGTSPPAMMVGASAVPAWALWVGGGLVGLLFLVFALGRR